MGQLYLFDLYGFKAEVNNALDSYFGYLYTLMRIFHITKIDIKFTLMIIETINDGITIAQEVSAALSSLTNLLTKDELMHEETPDSYANWGEEDLENCFSISQLIREFIVRK